MESERAFWTHTSEQLLYVSSEYTGHVSTAQQQGCQRTPQTSHGRRGHDVKRYRVHFETNQETIPSHLVVVVHDAEMSKAKCAEQPVRSIQRGRL